MLSIECIDVGPGRLEARVRVGDGCALRTSAFGGFSDRAFELLPGLARHTCENERGGGLRAELGDTELPHALEHVAFELMALSGSPRSLRGETAWDFSADGRGVFRVRLEFDDDLVALGALKEGVSVVEWLATGEGPAPDVGAISSRLRAVRGAGRGEGTPTSAG